MKIYVMNSAMMPEDGTYTRKRITTQDFSNILHQADEIKSSVSYPDVVDVIENFSGIRVSLAGYNGIKKEITVLEENNCTILVAKLNFRLRSELKGIFSTKDVNSYEFFLVNFKR